MLTQTNFQQALDLFRDHLSARHGQHAEDDDGALSLRLGNELVGSCLGQLVPYSGLIGG